jgi:hypothetical protein
MIVSAYGHCGRVEPAMNAVCTTKPELGCERLTAVERMRPSLDHHRSIALVDELWPVLKILETCAHVVEQLAIGEIDRARGSRGRHERRHVVENQA